MGGSDAVKPDVEEVAVVGAAVGTAVEGVKVGVVGEKAVADGKNAVEEGRKGAVGDKIQGGGTVAGEEEERTAAGGAEEGDHETNVADTLGLVYLKR